MLGLGCAHKATSSQSSSSNVGTSLSNLAGSETGSFELVDHGLIPIALMPSSVLKNCNYFPLHWAGPLWNPTKDQAVAALGQIPSLLSNNRPEIAKVVSKYDVPYLQSLRSDLTNELCQVVGVTVGRNKGIWLNFLPTNDRTSREWRSRYVRTTDGGPRFWSVLYLPVRDEFTHLRIDLGF